MTATDCLRRLRYRLLPPLFTLRVLEGVVTLAGGTATPAFLRDCSALASASRIRSGWIWGTGRPGDLTLDFSSGIVGRDRQRFRNIAGVHR